MIDVDLTEQEVIDKLLTTAKANGQNAPRVVIANRVVENPNRNIKRKVRFALVVSAGDVTLLDKLVALCIDNDMNFYFVGSDINLQDSLDVEYLYFEAEIMPQQQ
jgi:hypothetical protein